MHAMLTSKGQLTLPKAARDRLALKAGQRLKVEFTHDGNLKLRPERVDALAITRVLPAPRINRPLSQGELDTAIADAASQRFLRGLAGRKSCK